MLLDEVRNFEEVEPVMCSLPSRARPQLTDATAQRSIVIRGGTLILM